MKNLTTAILGASDKPERYSYKAMIMLKTHGHDSYLIHPTLKKINNLKVYKNLDEIKGSIDTITLYIKPELQITVEKMLIASKARRVIFNPGTENQDLEDKLKASGKVVLRACTLVLLTTDQY